SRCLAAWLAHPKGGNVSSKLRPHFETAAMRHASATRLLRPADPLRWLLMLVLTGRLARVQAQPGWPDAGPADSASPADSPASRARQTVLLEITGAIGPATTEYLTRGMDQAVQSGASVVILRIDTPGGLVSSLRDINRHILASPIPVIAFVAPAGAQAA